MLSDDWSFLLAICDLLYVTCCLNFLSETCYYLQKLVPLARGCTSRNFHIQFWSSIVGNKDILRVFHSFSRSGATHYTSLALVWYSFFSLFFCIRASHRQSFNNLSKLATAIKLSKTDSLYCYPQVLLLTPVLKFKV